MTKLYFLLILSFFSLNSFWGQNETFLTSEEKAYLYHIVMKSPTLNRNLEYIFDYSGPVNEKEPGDYLFIEEQILKEPSLLGIQFDEFQNQSSGVIAELSSKMALWTLYNELKKGINTKLEDDYSGIFRGFLDSLVEKCPKKLLVINRDKKNIFPKQHYKLLNPNLTYNKRKKLIKDIPGLEPNQEKELMDGIHYTIKRFTQRKAKDVYRMLGLSTIIDDNFLLAAGDGSGTAGLLGEVEKDNVDEKGVAKGVGLFTYKTDIIKVGKKDLLFSQKEPQEIINTLGYGKKTNLHLSLWGFNYSTQTTVAITKGEKTYLLYGSKYTGELSPDPAFNNNEKTYKNHIEKLKTEEIPDWEGEVYGEVGLEKKLDQLKINKKELLLAIEKNEYKESMYRMNQKKNRSKIKKIGNKLDYQHKKLWELNKRIEKANEEFQIGKLKLDNMKFRLTQMKKNLGEFEQDYKTLNHITYKFDDGTIFNLKTQDLVFEQSQDREQIEVRLLAVGSNPMSSFADEVQLNIAVTQVNDKEEIIKDIELSIIDGFKPDKYNLKELNFGKEADYLFKKITHYIIDNNLDINLDLYGGGIGEFYGTSIRSVKLQKPSELKTYPGETKEERAESKQKAKFKDLRVTNGSIKLTNKTIDIYLSSFTDPVKSNIFKTNSSLAAFSKQHPTLTGNEVLSGLRTYGVLDQLTKKMIEISKEHLKKDKEKADKYEKYFTDILAKKPVFIGDFRLEYSVYSGK